MAYTKTTLIARPASNHLGNQIEAALGSVWDTFKSGASGAIDFFGAGLKAQGAKEALEAQLAQQRPPAAPASEGVPTTALVVGGLAIAGLLVFAMRRK
jgi:hypothetical protein